MTSRQNGNGSPIRVDRRSVVPPRAQVRAALVQRIAEGALPIGAALPSVREMAAAAGLAPMTVTRVYAEMKDAGLVEARPGSGTFVAASSLSRPSARDAVAAIRAGLDALVDRALAAGLGLDDLAALLSAQATLRAARAQRPTFVMLGLFPAATESYAARIAAQLDQAATIRPLVLGPDPASDAAALREAELVITFPTLQARAATLAPGARIIGIRFIPAESTRLALASLDPMARVAVVSRFADFLPVLELGVRRFAPHVSAVAAMEADAPDLPRAVAASDVVVFSTGAEEAAEMARPGIIRIEYRHIPDPGDVERLVVPWLRPHAARGEDGGAGDHRKEAS